MKKTDLPNIFANIAASYARRELDRSVYDRLMCSPLGVRLAGLDTKNKYALEFIAYSITAVALLQKPDAGSIRTFVNGVLADAPSELAKRVINGAPKIYPNQIKSFLDSMTDDEISTLIEDIKVVGTTDETSCSNQSACELERPSALSELAEKIEKSRRQIQKRRRK